jgi:hypothetical protein
MLLDMYGRCFLMVPRAVIRLFQWLKERDRYCVAWACSVVNMVPGSHAQAWCPTITAFIIPRPPLDARSRALHGPTYRQQQMREYTIVVLALDPGGFRFAGSPRSVVALAASLGPAGRPMYGAGVISCT